MKGPKSSYLKGIGSIGSSLPLAGPNEGAILEFFELISVWAETAYFQLTTPRGKWRGPISGSEGSSDLPLREHGEPLSVGLEICLASRNSPVAGRDPLPYWQGFRVRTEQGMGCVRAPDPASH